MPRKTNITKLKYQNQNENKDNLSVGTNIILIFIQNIFKEKKHHSHLDKATIPDTEK